MLKQGPPAILALATVFFSILHFSSMKRFWPALFLVCLSCSSLQLFAAQDITVVSLTPYVISDAGRPIPTFSFPTTPIPPSRHDGSTRPQIEIASLLINPAGQLSWGPDRQVSGAEQLNLRKYVLGEEAVADLKILRDDSLDKEYPRCVWLTIILHPNSASLSGKDATPRIQVAYPGRVLPNDLNSLRLLAKRRFVIWVDGTIDEQSHLILPYPESEDAKQTVNLVTVNLAHWRFLPARKNGKPVSAPLRFPIVFVPPNETVSTRQTLACLKLQPDMDETSAPVPLAWAPIAVPFTFTERTLYRAVINADGQIATVATLTPGGEPLEPEILAGLQAWQFSPSISHGQRKPSEIRFSLRAIQPPDVDAEGSSPAKPALFTEAVYPDSLVVDLDELNTAQVWGPRGRGFSGSTSASAMGSAGVITGSGAAYGGGRVAGPSVRGIGDIPPRSFLATYKLFDGSVEVAYAVEADGTVQNFRILRSTGQAFEVSAIRALLERRYEPARNERGEPVHVTARETITFRGDSNFLASRYFPPAATHGTNMPTVVHLAQPIYPREALSKKQDGKAVAEFTVGPDGKTCGIKIVSATQACFGEALRAALDACEFTPPVGTDHAGIVLRRAETFRRPRRSPPMLKVGQTPSLVAMPIKLDAGEKVYAADALDVAPRHLLKTPPRFPTALLESSPTVKRGEALMDVVIDTHGRVCDAEIVSATHLAFAYAAVQATAGWLFAPAVKDGVHVACRQRLPIEFVAP